MPIHAQDGAGVLPIAPTSPDQSICQAFKIRLFSLRFPRLWFCFLSYRLLELEISNTLKDRERSAKKGLLGRGRAPVPAPSPQGHPWHDQALGGPHAQENWGASPKKVAGSGVGRRAAKDAEPPPSPRGPPPPPPFLPDLHEP